MLAYVTLFKQQCFALVKSKPCFCVSGWRYTAAHERVRQLASSSVLRVFRRLTHKRTQLVSVVRSRVRFTCSRVGDLAFCGSNFSVVQLCHKYR